MHTITLSWCSIILSTLWVSVFYAPIITQLTSSLSRRNGYFSKREETDWTLAMISLLRIQKDNPINCRTVTMLGALFLYSARRYLLCLPNDSSSSPSGASSIIFLFEPTVVFLLYVNTESRPSTLCFFGLLMSFIRSFKSKAKSVYKNVKTANYKHWLNMLYSILY